jgi:hypothetical protein
MTKFWSVSAGRVGLLALVTLSTLVASAPSNAQNLVTGSCSDLERFILRIGVTDDLGKRRPRKEGWTNPHFGYGVPIELTTEKTKVANGRTCITADIQVVFTAAPETRVVQWNPSPPGCNVCSCSFEVDNWNAQVKAHEDVHRNDAVVLATNASTRWENVELTACRATHAAAALALNQKIQRNLASELGNLKLLLSRRQTNITIGPNR